MAIIQKNNENQPKISLPRRIAAYITSMNFAKVFRRHHHHHSKESNSPISKSFDQSTFLHHQYARPFSYHIPSTEQITATSLLKPSNVIPYRIGISSDSTILNNGQTNENDEIVRLPMKNGRGLSPKMRKDRRHQSQLNANKRWLFRSMETLDGWKGKVFPQKQRTSNSSQTRSRSVENLADRHPDENSSVNPDRPMHKQQHAFSPNRSIEAITTRVINSIGIHRKSTNSIPNPTRTPALTIEKQKISNGKLNQNNKHRMNSSSAILDFREISSFGYLESRRSSDDNENNSLTTSENLNNDIHLSDDDDDDEITSNLSFIANDFNHQMNNDNEISDSWDFSITWIDSLKEQHSPQRKIQFYENLIKLLEQDTLNIDELLVLRKVLSRIWPTDESTSINIDSNNSLPPIESRTNGTRSLRNPNSIQRRSKLPTLTNHTAQRCSTILEPSPLIYEALNEHYSGQKTKSSTSLLAAKAKPCLVENDTKQDEKMNYEQHYPQHLNPFNDDTDNTPSAPPYDETNSHNNESIRRYFERLTLLETIYEKLNIESTKKPVETKENFNHQSSAYSTNKTESSKTMSNRFVEMNVDGNGSISSRKSSIKRRAPKAPHLSQTNHNNNPPMFTLSSADLNIPPKIDHEIHIPIQITQSEDKVSKERTAHDTAASCDDDGHIFVYDSTPNHQSNNEEPTVILPRKSERIQQWLSTCETKEEEFLAPHSPSPKSQYKIRCTAKPIRHQSPSPTHSPNNNHSSPVKHELEPGRFRSCLKIHLETLELPHQRSRAYSATSKYYDQQQVTSYEDFHCSDENSYQRDRQSVFL